MLTAAALATLAALAWYLLERSRRRTRAMAGGLHPEITLPHRAEFELWHNAFSLCSKKVRFCLAELDLPHVSHHVDLIETGSYQTLGRDFLAVNPAALVPVLVHHGHPVYESHEIIRYAAEHSPHADPLVPPHEAERTVMDHWIHKSSLFGDDPMAATAESAGNCVPGLTFPLFAAMIASIPAWRIGEGLLFHRLKRRAGFFLVMKMLGPARLPILPPLVEAIRRSRTDMERHLDDLEAQLAGGGPWIAGERFTLADVSWAVILDRLREADWTDLLESPRRPSIAAWWQRLRARPAYTASMLGEHAHPLVTRGTGTIRALKAGNETFRRRIYG